MKVILLSDVKNVGKKDQVVEVSDGYARNFLLKRNLAVAQTQGSMKVLHQQQEEAKKLEELLAQEHGEKEHALQILEEICHCIELLAEQMPANEREGYQLRGMIDEIRTDEERIDTEGNEFHGAKTVADAWLTDFYDLCEACGCRLEEEK